MMSFISRSSLRYWLGKTLYNIVCNLTAITARLKAREFQSSQGILRYYIHNNPGKPMLVFLHGFSGNKELWLNTVWSLRHSHSVLIPDLPGHGESDAPSSSQYQPEDHASLIEELLQAEGIKTCCLVGSSMGCAVAAALLAESRARIPAALFINPFGVTREQITAIQHFKAGTTSPFQIESVDDYHEFFSLISCQPMWIPRWIKDYLAIEHMRRNDQIAQMFSALKSSEPFLPRLQALQKKQSFSLIVLAGQQDAVVTTECFSMLEQELDNCQLYWLDDSGHLPMLETPKVLATAIQCLLPCSEVKTGLNTD